MSPVGEIEEGFLKKELSMSYFPWSQDFKYTFRKWLWEWMNFLQEELKLLTTFLFSR